MKFSSPNECKCFKVNHGRFDKLIHSDEDLEWWGCIACYDTWFVGEEE